METRKAKTFNDMTVGTEWKCILLFALPLMLGQLLQQLYSTVDGIVVGNYVSSGALAAVGNCTSMVMVFLAFSNGLSNGSGIIISQYFGAGREKDMRIAAANVLLLMGVLGVVMTAVAVFGARFLTAAVLGIDDAAIQQEAETYLRIYGVGLIFNFIYNGVAATLRAVGDSKALLLFLFVSTLVNTVLDLLFVCVLGLGIAGAAWATVISQVACVIVSICYMFRHYPVFRFADLRELRFDSEKIRLCLKLGVPTMLQQLTVSCGHVVLQRLINSFGAVTMAAVTVGMRVDHYSSIPMMGMMISMSSFAGQNTGAGRYDRVKRGLVSAIVMGFVTVIVICVLLYLFAPPLAALFGVAGETLSQAVEYLRFIAFAFPIFALYIPFNGLFQGCGEPLAAAAVSLVALGVRVALAYLLVLVFHYDYHALWYPYLWGWLASLIVAVLHFATGKWRTKAVVHRNPEAVIE